MKKRLFSLIVCIMMLLSSCSGDVIDPIITMPNEELPTSEITEAPSAVSLAGYKVIRSAQASNSIVTAAVELKKTLSESVESVTIGDDWYKTGDTTTPKCSTSIIIKV